MLSSQKLGKSGSSLVFGVLLHDISFVTFLLPFDVLSKTEIKFIAVLDTHQYFIETSNVHGWILSFPHLKFVTLTLSCISFDGTLVNSMINYH